MQLGIAFAGAWLLTLLALGWRLAGANGQAHPHASTGANGDAPRACQ